MKKNNLHVILCFLPQVLILLLALGAWGRGGWLLLAPAFLLVVVPVLDQLTGWQDNNHYEKASFSPIQARLLEWNTRLYTVLFIGLAIWLAASIDRFEPHEVCLLVGINSLMAGICFAAVHELLHSRQHIDQVLQRIAATFLFYPNYQLIHIRSHHLHVATENDANSSLSGESIYAYIPRTIVQSAIKSWKLACKSAATENTSAFQRFYRNEMIACVLGQLFMLAALYFLIGNHGLLFYLAYMVGGNIVLESVNYIQHYGLVRERKASAYEKTGAEHSWDSYHFFSSYVTFRVGHHSSHHLAVKPYYLLGTEPRSPKLPVGYVLAIGIVFIPGLWRLAIGGK